MSFKYKTPENEESNIDVTAFMNLMIVLVPVLLLSMTFSSLSVLEIQLPELTGGFQVSKDAESRLEVEVSQEGYRVYYPENTLQSNIPLITHEDGSEQIYDKQKLLLVLQAIKQKKPDLRSALLRASPDVAYGEIIGALDHIKSYKTVVATSVVEVELFPEVSLDDARNQ